VETKYGIGIDVQPRWKIPQKVFISQTIVGAFYSKKGKPESSVKPDEIRDQALAAWRRARPTYISTSGMKTATTSWIRNCSIT
jgi:hypothetical protein